MEMKTIKRDHACSYRNETEGNEITGMVSIYELKQLYSQIKSL